MADEEKKNTCEQEFKECMNETLTQEYHQLWHLAWIGAIAFSIMGIALWFSPWVFDSVQDPEALYRWAIIKFPQAFVTVFILLGSVALADLVFPGDLLKRVIHEPIAAAIVIASLFLSVALTLM